MGLPRQEASDCAVSAGSRIPGCQTHYTHGDVSGAAPPGAGRRRWGALSHDVIPSALQRLIRSTDWFLHHLGKLGVLVTVNTSPVQLPAPGPAVACGASVDTEAQEGAEASRKRQKPRPKLAQHALPGNIQRGTKQQSEFQTRAEALTPADRAPSCGHADNPRIKAASRKGLGREDSGPVGWPQDPKPSVRGACGAWTLQGPCPGGGHGLPRPEDPCRMWKPVEPAGSGGVVRSVAALGGTIARSWAL